MTIAHHSRTIPALTLTGPDRLVAFLTLALAVIVVLTAVLLAPARSDPHSARVTGPPASAQVLSAMHDS